MKINIENIKGLNPCEDGLDNLVTHYPNLSVNMSTFLKLEHIPYEDKLWLVRELVDTSILQQWGLDCAESVMHLSNDIRVSNCIEMTKRYLLNECTLDELSDARSAAANAAPYAADAAYYAANAAARSDAYAAAMSDAYAAVMSAYYAASYAADAAADLNTQQDINVSLLIALLEN
jgi:hypothetical protein